MCRAVPVHREDTVGGLIPVRSANSFCVISRLASITLSLNLIIRYHLISQYNTDIVFMQYADRKNIFEKYEKRSIIIDVRQRTKPLMKGSEEMDEMTAAQTTRLIEWLKSKGLSTEEILDCIQYINK